MVDSLTAARVGALSTLEAQQPTQRFLHKKERKKTFDINMISVAKKKEPYFACPKSVARVC